MLRWIKKTLLTIPEEHFSFERLGYAESASDIRRHLEQVARLCLGGFNLRLEITDHDVLTKKLEQEHDSHHVVFPFEGVGMYLSLIDLLSFGRTNHLSSFIEHAGQKYDYLVAIGGGFAVPHVPWGLRILERYRNRLGPDLAWCIADGFGFHQGLFHHRRFVEQCQAAPQGLPVYDHAPFHSGVGRSIWWVAAASPKRIWELIDRFPEERRGELWNGIGLACSFAGGIGEDELKELLYLAGRNRPDFLSGIPFSARVRQKAGKPSYWTDLACQSLLNMTANQAADLILLICEEGESDPANTQQAKLEGGYAFVRERLVAHFQDTASPI